MKAIADILRDNAFARLNHLKFFDDVYLVNNEKGLNEADIKNTFATHIKKTGKKGASVLVDFARYRFNHPAATRPLFELALPITVMESTENNRGAAGTGKHVQEIAEAVIDALHNVVVAPGLNALHLTGGETGPELDAAAKCLFVIIEFAVGWGLAPSPRIGMPQVTLSAAGLVTISVHQNFAGARIYWTVDGSWPSADNPAATLYTDPFQLDDAARRVCAVAFKEGYQPSDVAVPRR